jgi:hypothetical protein
VAGVEGLVLLRQAATVWVWLLRSASAASTMRCHESVVVLKHELARRLQQFLAGGDGRGRVVADAGVDAAQMRTQDLRP